MAENCRHPAYSIVGGDLLCVSCDAPSPSPKWREAVFGKAVSPSETENKGLIFPPESKRMKEAPK